MLDSTKYSLRRYPKIKNTYNTLRWKQHIWSDWLNTYIFKKTIQYDTPYGFKMISRNYIANRMMMDGTFETEEVEIIRKNLLNADVFVDVGANIGFYTCIARSLGKYAIAIEPQPQNLSCLYTNLNNTSKNLDLLLQDFRLNPKRYVNVSVFGKKQKEYTVPELDPAMKQDTVH